MDGKTIDKYTAEYLVREVCGATRIARACLGDQQIVLTRLDELTARIVELERARAEDAAAIGELRVALEAARKAYQELQAKKVK